MQTFGRVDKEEIVFRVKQGHGKPSKIYVRQIFEGPEVRTSEKQKMVDTKVPTIFCLIMGEGERRTQHHLHGNGVLVYCRIWLMLGLQFLDEEHSVDHIHGYQKRVQREFFAKPQCENGTGALCFTFGDSGDLHVRNLYAGIFEQI